jgi:hypothetical protein
MDLVELEPLIKATEARLALLREAFEGHTKRIQDDPMGYALEMARRAREAEAAIAIIKNPPLASDEEIIDVLLANEGPMRRCDLTKALAGKRVVLDDLVKLKRIKLDGTRGSGAKISFVA